MAARRCLTLRCSRQIERRALNEKAKGNEMYKAGEYRAAIQSYTHALRLQQNNAVVHANRGMCHLKLKQYRQALADCTAAVQIDGLYTKAYLRRGIAHRRLGQHAQAVADLNVVLEREPRNQEASEHLRCSQVELEHAQRELAAAGKGTDQAGTQNSRLIIEEVDGDSDDDAGGLGNSDAVTAPQNEALRRLYHEEQEKDRNERERAARNEADASRRPGRFVDPQALQESEQLLSSLGKLGGGLCEQSAPSRESASHNSQVEAAQFIPAARFEGPREGRVFKLGPRGLGYYQDPASGRSVPCSDKEPVGDRATPGMRRVQIVEDDEEEEAATSASAAKGTAAAAPMRRVEIVEDDEDEEEEAATSASAAKGTAAAAPMRRVEIVEDDEDDEEEAATSASAAKGTAAAAPMRRVQIVEDDEDEEEEAATSASAAKGTAAAAPMRRVKIVEDDDEEEAVEAVATGSAHAGETGASGMRRLQIEDEDEEDEENHQEAVVSPAVSAAAAAAEQLREDGNALFKTGQYDAATLKYSEAIDNLRACAAKNTALLTKCLNNRAACACQLQQYKQAAEDCSEVLRAVPTDAKALMRRAFAFEALERYAEALHDMRAVVALQPSAKDASAACIRLSRLVAAQSRQEQEDAATKPPSTTAATKGTEATKAEPGTAAAAVAAAADEVKARGTEAFRAGDFKKAAELYYEASRTAPECHTHFSNLALALLKLGQPQHAVTAARRCTELAPLFAKGHYRLGQALRAHGDTDAACAAFRAGLAQATGTEAAELRRELEACKRDPTDATSPCTTEPATSTPVGGKPTSGEVQPSTIPKGRVDASKAADIARRVAERAQSAQVGASARQLQSFTSFERTFTTLWAKGKCTDVPRLREQLELLPNTPQSLAAFMGDSLSSELLSALVLATERALSPDAPAAAAALVCRLSQARRFEMLWMFLGKAEHAAAEQVFRRAIDGGGCKPDEEMDIVAVCKRCGIRKPTA